jgi:hypothetical protein
VGWRQEEPNFEVSLTYRATFYLKKKKKRKKENKKISKLKKEKPN